MLYILKSKVDEVNMQQALARVDTFVQSQGFYHIVTLNAEIAYMANSDEKLQRIINKADLVTPDGSGIVWASEKLGSPLPERVTGIDLMYEICRLAAQKGYSVFLLGSEEGVAQAAAEALKAKYPGIRICGAYHGYFLKEENGREKVFSLIREASPDIIFVAMGAPKQEYIIEEMRKILKKGVFIGVGGSFDVIAGKVKRAPRAVQKMRLEWLWRSLLQPSRWKRTMRLPLFMSEVKKQIKKQNKN